MTILGLAVFAAGYVLWYYGANILIHAYVKKDITNPAPLSVLVGIPGAGDPGTNGNQGNVGPHGPAVTGE